MTDDAPRQWVPYAQYAAAKRQSRNQAMRDKTRNTAAQRCAMIILDDLALMNRRRPAPDQATISARREYLLTFYSADLARRYRNDQPCTDYARRIELQSSGLELQILALKAEPLRSPYWDLPKEVKEWLAGKVTVEDRAAAKARGEGRPKLLVKVPPTRSYALVPPETAVRATQTKGWHEPDGPADPAPGGDIGDDPNGDDRFYRPALNRQWRLEHAPSKPHRW